MSESNALDDAIERRQARLRPGSFNQVCKDFAERNSDAPYTWTQQVNGWLVGIRWELTYSVLRSGGTSVRGGGESVIQDRKGVGTRQFVVTSDGRLACCFVSAIPGLMPFPEVKFVETEYALKTLAGTYELYNPTGTQDIHGRDLEGLELDATSWVANMCAAALT